jgi:hypothetical protein
MPKNIPTPGDNVIDSRDIIARLEELREELYELESPEAVQEWHDDNDDEYLPLVKLVKECEGCGDWEYGETMIHRRIFVDYCRERCVDCEYIPENLPTWIEIDWQKTADNMEQDYTTVDFDGHEYLIRAC